MPNPSDLRKAWIAFKRKVFLESRVRESDGEDHVELQIAEPRYFYEAYIEPDPVLPGIVTLISTDQDPPRRIVNVPEVMFEEIDYLPRTPPIKLGLGLGYGER